MKLFRKSLGILAAISAAALLPACSGGANTVNGTANQFVSVSAFKSGSCGFYVQGSPVVRIISRGQPNDINPGSNPFPSIGRLDTWKEDMNVLGSGDSEEEWLNFAGNMADVERGEQSCIVNVTINNSSTNEYSIDGVATYVTSGSMGYLELYFDEVEGSNNNLNFAALIHFMGAVTRSDLTYSTDGDSSDSSGAVSSEDQRIMITSLTGSVIKFWFNFETNMALTELCYVARTKLQDMEGHEVHTPPGMRGVWRITHPFLRQTN